MSRKASGLKTGNPFISAKKPGFTPALTLWWLRHVFKILACLVPALAEKMALRFFLTPPRHAIPEWQKPYIASARSFEVNVKGKTIRFYEWGKAGPTVLLVHGWGGRGSQMGAFVNPLLAAGYRVLALDGPAHGASSGKQSDMFEFAAAIAAANQVAGGALDAIIAHSFGSACTLLALRENRLKVARLILIGCPSNAIWITENFAEKLSISKQIVAGMRKQFERRYRNQWTWEDLSLVGMIKEVTCPILLIHDRNDSDVPWQQAVELQRANPASKFFSSEGLGHRRILRSPEIINICLGFIKIG